MCGIVGVVSALYMRDRKWPNKASKILPAKFYINRKQGFSIPLYEWLKKGPLCDLF